MEIFCCKSFKNSPLRKREHLLVEGELALTCHCRRESKNLDGRKNIAWNSGLIQAISCSRRVGTEESEESYGEKQRQTRFLSLTRLSLICLLLQACFAEVILHLWQAVKHVLRLLLCKNQFHIDALVQFLTDSFWKQLSIFAGRVALEHKSCIGTLACKV